MPAVRVSKNPNLTRRAKQAHNDIIAKIVKPAPENPKRVFHLYVEFSKCGFNSANLSFWFAQSPARAKEPSLWVDVNHGWSGTRNPYNLLRCLAK